MYVCLYIYIYHEIISHQLKFIDPQNCVIRLTILTYINFKYYQVRSMEIVSEEIWPLQYGVHNFGTKTKVVF